VSSDPRSPSAALPSHPGDNVVADADGVVIVPRHRADWAADQVAQAIDKEEALRRRIVAARG
jgi:regulator of RNase E activity RraA